MYELNSAINYKRILVKVYFENQNQKKNCSYNKQ